MRGRRGILLSGLVGLIIGSALFSVFVLYKKRGMNGVEMGYVDTAGPRTFYADDLAKRQPADIQNDLKEIFGELVARRDSDLFVLKSSEDPCLLEEMIFCRLIPSEKVKPFIEAALAFKQDAQSRQMSVKNNLVSFGSLVVSFIGLIIAGLSFAYRKKSS